MTKYKNKPYSKFDQERGFLLDKKNLDKKWQEILESANNGEVNQVFASSVMQDLNLLHAKLLIADRGDLLHD
ncbi:MAG: hypothetical protein Q8876_05670 [Bacillota bacterium]|nr:hypothetical protein [Bacillota bacterium]